MNFSEYIEKLKQIKENEFLLYKDMHSEIGISQNTLFNVLKGIPVRINTKIKIKKWVDHKIKKELT